MACWDEEYRGLVEDVRDAMQNLFDAARPDGWTELRRAYTEVDTALRLDEAHTQLSEIRDELSAHVERQKDSNDSVRRQQEERQEEWRRHMEEKRAWRALDPSVKEAWILEAIGDDALTKREIVDRLRGAHTGVDIFESRLVAPLNDLLAAGELEREKEPRTPNCTVTKGSSWRWRWRRRRPELSDEMRGLEQQLGEA